MYKSQYETHVMTNPSLPFIFHTDIVLAHQAQTIRSNWHTNIELLHCIEGEGQVILDGRSMTFNVGDTVCVNSKVIHRVISDDKVRYRCLIVESGFCAENGIDAERLCFEEHFSSKVMDDRFSELYAEYDKDESSDSLRRAKIRCAVLQIMIELCENHIADRMERDSEKMNLDRVKKALDYIHGHFSEPVTLDELAHYAGVSRYYLSRSFREATGSSPIEYINTVRCKEARQLIERGSPVSEAARICGFDNMSYFTRTFKKNMGILPSKIREGQLAIPKE